MDPKWFLFRSQAMDYAQRESRRMGEELHVIERLVCTVLWRSFANQGRRFHCYWVRQDQPFHDGRIIATYCQGIEL